MKRPRGRGRRNNNSNHNNPNKHFESNGPDVRIRGSAQQVLDKYMQYARDAQTSGDRVNAENYFQHAEHYLRVLAKLKPKEKPRETREDDNADEVGRDEVAAKSDEPRHKDTDRRPHRPRPADKDEAGTDPLKVIDGNKADNDVAAKPDTSDDEAPKPRRRRTYKKREETAEADAPSAEPIEDGVMKTLSRGRKKPAAAKTEATPEGDTPAEAAE